VKIFIAECLLSLSILWVFSKKYFFKYAKINIDCAAFHSQESLKSVWRGFEEYETFLRINIKSLMSFISLEKKHSLKLRKQK